MSPDAPQPSSFSPWRRLGIGFNVALSAVLLLAVVLMVNYLAARHFRRLEWVGHARFSLSPQTKRVLEALTNQVRVSVLFDREAPLFGYVSGLLKQYAYACPKVSVEAVDYTRNPDRARLLIEKYQLPPTAGDQVVFDLDGRTNVVAASEMSVYDWSGVLKGEKEVHRIGFKGEALFTAALASLLEGRAPVAYFLQGHGEHNPAGTEGVDGYASFTRLLQHKNIAPKVLSLVGEAAIPADCQLLIVAGPKDPLEPAEVEKIGKYLEGGGRLLALLSYNYRANYHLSGLERLLINWGVLVGENLVVDRSHSTQAGTDLVCTNFSPHPVVRPLYGRAIHLFLASSVSPLPGAGSPDAARAQTLVATSPEGFTASERTGDALRFNPTRDVRGVIPLIVAVEKGSMQGVSADRLSTRLIVAGDSIFLCNQAIEGSANLEFASLAVNWLLDRPQYLAGISPRPVREYHLTLTQGELVRVRWILLVGLPGAVLLVGLLVWVRRRS